MAQTILGVLAEGIYVTEEKRLDMAIALSGSDPAYVLLWDMAQELAIQTILGSARTVERADEHPADLTNTVTSLGEQ